ncbi:MAG: DinB family protein [Calditrichia bacterium]|nr:DinB family protein [Calditrichota bacterium]MCB0268057.1 DinB family protein [Calditrichota bacterium]MCB0286806.1 DinB family protein [Calditrichota bacterium]MCB9067156.1 DinB family protein [Calditrichia bacterium]
MIDYFKKMFEYNFWANNRTIESLKSATSAPESSLLLLSHIFAAEEIWFSRLIGKHPETPVFPQFSLSECDMQLRQQHDIWVKYLADISVADLFKLITYRNSKGEPFTNTPTDILAHVINHGTYHRSQIALQLRQSGEVPAVTDYIFFKR